MSTTRTPRIRMSKQDRRNQLLDAAETLLVERGSAAMTMERLAEFAGVSKALPYSHFDNSDEVLVAVYQRVVSALGQRILDRLAASGDDDDRIRIVVATYFEAVRVLGPILSVVTAPGSRSSELANSDRRQGVRFISRLLGDYFGASPERARAAAPILLPALTGAVTAWASGDADQHEAERLCAKLIAAVLE